MRIWILVLILSLFFSSSSLWAQSTVRLIDMEIGDVLPAGTRIIFPSDAPIPHPQRREWGYFHFAGGTDVNYGPVSTMNPNDFILGCRFNFPDWQTSYLHIFHMGDIIAPTNTVFHWVSGWFFSTAVIQRDVTLVYKDITDTSLLPNIQVIIPNSGIDADLGGVLMLLSALLVESERKRELLQDLSILGQYQLGLTAFLSGMVLCFVFVFGMRLR